MLLTYAPEGAEPQTWVFAADRLMTSEAEAIEKVTGSTYEEFGKQLVKNSQTARRALLWVMLKRQTPTLRHAQVDPPVGSITLEYEAHELRAFREILAARTDISNAERDEVLSDMDALIEEAGGEDPKAPENVVALNG